MQELRVLLFGGATNTLNSSNAIKHSWCELGFLHIPVSQEDGTCPSFCLFAVNPKMIVLNHFICLFICCMCVFTDIYVTVLVWRSQDTPLGVSCQACWANAFTHRAIFAGICAVSFL